MKPLIGITSKVEWHDLSARNEEYHLCASFYAKAIARAGGAPLHLGPAAANPREYLQLCDGFVLSGGRDVNPCMYHQESWYPHLCDDLERDAFEIELIDRAFKSHKPMLAICRGMQILNVAMGGSLIQEIDCHAIEHKQSYASNRTSHTVHVDEASALCAAIGNVSIDVNSFHHQAIGRLGEGLRAVGRAPDGTIEAVEGTGESGLLGVQWHPECLCDNFQEHAAIFREFVCCIRNSLQPIATQP